MGQRLNRYIFVKNGYPLLRHVVPIAIAALLLLTLTVPQENLLLKLASELEQFSWTLLPATILIMASAAVYFFTMRTQVRKAHLHSARDTQLTVTTSLVFVGVCWLMAFLVLSSATPNSVMLQNLTLGNFLACLLVAVLSLTGFGWQVPASWVDSVGVRSPDYSEGRLAAERITEILERVRTSRPDEQDLEDFKTAVEGLRSSIDKNLDAEPEWAKADLNEAKGALRNLIEQTDGFLGNGQEGVTNFKNACDCNVRGRHEQFINSLEILGRRWEKWKCQTEEKS